MNTFATSISTPTGPLSLDLFPYRLEKDTRSNQQVSLRRVEAKNPFVQGAYLVNAVKENVTETLNVYVKSTSDSATYNATKALTDALEQITYSISFNRNDYTETWTCFASEYQIATQHEFQHAGLVLVRASVVRLPSVVKVP